MAKKGTFQPGRSGNPTGRPKVAEEFRSRCRRATDDKVFGAWLDEIELRPREVTTKDGDTILVMSRGRDWPKAAELLAAYGYGKPAQPLTGANGEGAAEISITLNVVGAKT